MTPGKIWCGIAGAVAGDLLAGGLVDQFIPHVHPIDAIFIIWGAVMLGFLFGIRGLS